MNKQRVRINVHGESWTSTSRHICLLFHHSFPERTAPSVQFPVWISLRVEWSILLNDKYPEGRWANRCFKVHSFHPKFCYVGFESIYSKTWRERYQSLFSTFQKPFVLSDIVSESIFTKGKWIRINFIYWEDSVSHGIQGFAVLRAHRLLENDWIINK